MKKFKYHQFNHVNYFGIISVLDYEFSSNYYLKSLSFPEVDKSKKLLIDLALKVGVTQYRFVEVSLNNNGTLDWETLRNVQVSQEIERFANSLLKSKSTIVLNSILTKRQKRLILQNV